MISQGSIPDPPPGTPVLEFEPPLGQSKVANMTMLFLFVALWILGLVLGAGSALLFAPFLLLGAWPVFRRIRRPRPGLTIRADGILLGSVLFGDELFIPWSAIEDVESQPLVAGGFQLSVGDRSDLIMESRIARVLDDLLLRVFAGGRLSILAPNGITASRFHEMLERRILEEARRDTGLPGGADRDPAG